MPSKPKPMTVTDAYNKAKTKGKPSKEAYNSFNTKKPKVSSVEYKRNQVTKSGMGSGSRTKTTSGMGSGNRTSSASVGASREKVTRTGQGSGNTGPKKNNKSFLDRVGGIGKGVGRFGSAIAKDTYKMASDPTGYAINTAKQIGKDVKNRNIAGLGLAAASMIPIPGAKGTAAAIKAAGKAAKVAGAAGKAGKATKSLSELVDDAIKSSKSLKPKPKPTPAQVAKTKEVKEKLAENPIRKPKPATPKPKPKPEPAPKPERELRYPDKDTTPAEAAEMARERNEILSGKYGLPKELKPVDAPPKPKGPKVDTTPKAGSFKPKPKPKPAEKTSKPAESPRVSNAQSELDAARAELKALKAAKGGKYKDDIAYKRITEKIRAKEQKVANAVKSEATGSRPPRGVGRVMTDSKPKAGDAQRTYSGVGRSPTPRTGVTESPKPNRGQYEGDMLRGQARNDAASMSNRGLRGSSRATREGRVTENKARNAENIKIRENDRKVAKYNDMLAKAKASKKPKDIAAAKNYADFWKLKGIKKLK